ncbi:DUF952 domain-containing protein [Actinomadura barringtoniae]|uniref:DUF952 domain-containing protein n=1 Tax=Actinomadura barringtoniae TaxID=1427535 RepID=A0A939PMX8_9ACTN|nr:DUF952 domain-containing protein [Actinomadura barringtoniae]MBO2455580.1 DUF952 domain-containing protein [Actinomadura barringtoniae]
MSEHPTAIPQETLLHIAERRHWESAEASGESYAMSTLGRTLADEGFIHCSADQAQAEGVLANFYTAVDRADLVLLIIDPARLGSEVRHEPADGQLFPHIYGPIPLTAVIDVRSVPETR